MKSIPVQKILNIDNPAEFKLHVARQYTDGANPLDIYVRDRKEWRDWNTWGQKNQNIFGKKYIFSLIDFYPESDMWLFGGAYEVIETYMDREDKDFYRYNIKDLKEYADYVGRLKIEMPRPKHRGRSFYLEKHWDKMTVSEILKEPYSGETFPGYESINHPFNILKPIFRIEKSDWKGALENVKGVYVITDVSNGKNYVGSAYGESGIWARWHAYMRTGHGGNTELRKVIQKKGKEYAQENFKLALLEHRPMRADDKLIHERETYWKEVFLSRGDTGYNKN